MFKNEVSIGDILTFLGMTLAAISIFLSFMEYRKNNDKKRAEFLSLTYSTYMWDPEILDLYHKIEAGNFRYRKEIHGSLEEKNLDKLLGIFEYAARLLYMKNIKQEDFTFGLYEFLVLYKNREVRKYIYSLDKKAREKGINLKTYEKFRKIGEKLEKEYRVRVNNL